MSRAAFSPRAECDLNDVCAYIAANNPDAAEKVRRIILIIPAKADFLAQHPEAGRRILKAGPRHAHTRWLVVPRYRNYLIFYHPLGDTIVVVRVLHAARDWTRFFPDTPSQAG